MVDSYETAWPRHSLWLHNRSDTRMRHVEASRAVAAARLARSAPILTVAQAAATTGAKPATVRNVLGAVAARGVCAATLRRAAAGNDTAVKAFASTHAACPPAAVRSVGADRSARAAAVSACAAGTAAWAARATSPHTSSAGALRSHAKTGTQTERRRAASSANTPAAVLTALAGDPDVTVRDAAAANRRASRFLAGGCLARSPLLATSAAGVSASSVRSAAPIRTVGTWAQQRPPQRCVQHGALRASR